MTRICGVVTVQNHQTLTSTQHVVTIASVVANVVHCLSNCLPRKPDIYTAPVAMDGLLKRGRAVFWKYVRVEHKCGKSEKWTDDLWTDNDPNWLRVRAFEAPWKRADMQVGKVKVLIITLTFTCRVTNVVRFHGNDDKYNVFFRGKGGRGLVEPQSSGQRASVKFCEVGRERQNVAPNFFPTTIRKKKYLKINKTGLNRLVKGHNSPTNSNNLFGLCFQAYLSVHSSENGQTATHFTRRKTDLRGKQWVTNPAWKPPKWRLNPHVVRVVYVSLK